MPSTLPSRLFVQQPHDLRANALSLILRRDIEFLLKEFVTYASKLNPADFLTIKDNDLVDRV